MRVYHQYTFKTGKRYTISELLSRIDSFLSEQELRYQQMAYDFISSDCTHIFTSVSADSPSYSWAQRQLKAISECHQLSEKYPDFGEPERNPMANSFIFRLSNLDDMGRLRRDGAREELLRTVAEKIPRPYNFWASFLMYYNVNFFSRTAQVLEETIKYPRDRFNTKCANITIFRDFTGPQTTVVQMMIDVTDGDHVLDSQPYADALSETLAGVRYGKKVSTAMSQEEIAQYKLRKQQAEPVLQRIKVELRRSEVQFGVPEFTGKRNIQTANFTLSRTVKRMGKKFGFDQYKYDPIGVHYLSKRTARGHWLTLMVDVPHLFNEIRLSAYFSGVGFNYVLPMPDFYVPDQMTADSILQNAITILFKLEADELLELSEHFPDSPAWYQKIGI